MFFLGGLSAFFKKTFNIVFIWVILSFWFSRTYDDFWMYWTVYLFILNALIYVCQLKLCEMHADNHNALTILSLWAPVVAVSFICYLWYDISVC